jgi:hypothetical protein
MYWVGTITAGMTAFYVFRAMFMTFFGEYRGHEHPHESPAVITVPLAVLAVLSVVGGFIRIPVWLEKFFPAVEAPEEFSLVAISVAAGLIGIALAYVMYIARPALADSISSNLGGVYRLIYNKYFVDEIYDATVVKPLVAGSRVVLWRGMDAGQAAIKNQTDIADLLIAKGVNVNARDQSGAAPLHQAALKGYVAFATLLLEHGAEVNARDGDGATPLHNAAVSGHRDLAALLLDHGADIEARDTESGATPLYHAAAWGRTPVVELLLSRGAALNATNKSGVTPLQAAIKNGFTETAQALRHHNAK